MKYSNFRDKTNRVIFSVERGLPVLDGRPKNQEHPAACRDLFCVGHIVHEYVVGVLQPPAAVCLAEVTKLIGENDSHVRNAAISAISDAFYQVYGL